ncbi:MAG: hypothetical protein IID54_08065, partial [Proteobacteria bacterium]|nr:hypothetical protein [Pseudomonadota bacterium]
MPTQEVARDPGLTVPDTAQFAGGLGDIGAAAFDVGQRIKGRQEGIARDRDDTEFSEILSNKFRDLQANADFADDRVIAQAMAEVDADEQRILDAHPGGAHSRALLERQFARRKVALGDQLAVQNIIASRAQRDASVDRRVAGIVADALSDLSVPVEERVPIEQRFGQLEDVIKFLDLPPTEARVALAGGKEKISAALIGQMITRGMIDENGFLINARSMLENEELREVLSPAVRGGLFDRIVNIENGVRKAGLNARDEVVALEAIANELGLTDEESRDFILATLTKGKISDKRAALDRLVAKGIVDQNTSDKIIGGTLRPVPVYDAFGNVVGAQIIDLTNLGGAQQAAPGQAAVPSRAELQALPA